MTRIEIRRRFLPALRDHFGRIRFTRHAPRPELFSLHVVFGLPRLPVIDLPANFDAFVVDLSAGFQVRVRISHGLPPAAFDWFRRGNQSGVRQIVPSAPGFEFRSVWEEARFSGPWLESFPKSRIKRAPI
jgi:hypothetical protein